MNSFFITNLHCVKFLPWYDSFILFFNSGTRGACFDIYYTGGFYNFYEICLVFFGLAVIFFAFCSVQSKNPIFSVLFLVLVFFSLGTALILLGFYFIGLLVIFIYVGAISILFLFVLMIVDLRVLFLDKEFLFENKFINFFFNILLLILSFISIVFIVINVNFCLELLNSSILYFKVFLSACEYRFRTFGFIFSCDYWELTSGAIAYIKEAPGNFSIHYKYNLVEFSSLPNDYFVLFKDDVLKIYAVKKEVNFGFLENFYTEGDIFGLGQYVFNYFMFQTFLVFCILLICLFGAVAVVINKTETRHIRSGQNTLQVKSFDFTIS